MITAPKNKRKIKKQIKLKKSLERINKKHLKLLRKKKGKK
jgi:hypothetical protein